MAARLTCYHEAAHIVCAWYFGFDIVGACVLSDSNFRRGLRDRFGKALKGAAGHMEYRRQTFLGRDRVARNGASTLMPYAEISPCCNSCRSNNDSTSDGRKPQLRVCSGRR